MGLSVITNLFKSPASVYVILRYLTYALQFLNSILLVKVLGEFAYGIYGFILMFIVYFIYLNFGVNDSLNAEYALNKNSIPKRTLLWNNSLSIGIIWYASIIGVSIIILYFFPTIFAKYEFRQYGFLLILACIIHNISILYATIYKIHGKTLKVNIEQLLPQLCILFLIIFGEKLASIPNITLVLLLSNLISLLLFKYKAPEKFSFSLNQNIIKLLLKRGISLLLYNLSFQLLTMLALAIVSIIYSVEQMGCYSLANGITNGVLMAGGAFLFIFFPKILNRMGKSDEAALQLIDKYESIYNVFIDFVSILSAIFVWLLSFAYPSYGTTFVKIYLLLVLGRIFNNCAMGYSAYMISRKKESFLMICGLCAVGVSGIGYGIVAWRGWSITTVPLMIVLASLCFSVSVIQGAQRKLLGKPNLHQIFRLLFGQSKWIIIVMTGIYCLILDNYIVLIAGFAFYLLINHKNLKYSFKNGYRIVSDKAALKF